MLTNWIQLPENVIDCGKVQHWESIAIRRIYMWPEHSEIKQYMRVCVCVMQLYPGTEEVMVEPGSYWNGSETPAVCVAQMFLSTITATGFASKCMACILLCPGSSPGNLCTVCNLRPIGCGSSCLHGSGSRGPFLCWRDPSLCAVLWAGLF